MKSKLAAIAALVLLANALPISAQHLNSGSIKIFGKASWKELATAPAVSASGDCSLYASTLHVFRASCNGSAWDTLPTLGADSQFTGKNGFGTAPNANARVIVTGQYLSTKYTQTYASTTAINWSNGNVQQVTLTGNTTFTFVNGISGGRYLLVVKQDATGSRVITWPAAVKWPDGGATPPTSGANKTDVFSLVFDGTNYFGGFNLNY